MGFLFLLLEMYGLANKKEMYFFTPLYRKHSTSVMAQRKAGNGYWKSTGREEIKEGNEIIGVKRSLIFYKGSTQINSRKTNWIMTEYNMGVHLICTRSL